MKRESMFETVNAHAAAIDIGAEKIFVSSDGSEVVSFSTYTADYHRCVNYLKENSIRRVAMEATGVYWIPLYELLEQRGFEVCLVNPKEAKQVKGRKTDVKDCQWIQKLFSAGLLRESFIPAGKLKELRMMVREREDVIDMGSAYINKMQKALELMNIKLTSVLSQIQGKSGRRMIEAIINGERDTDKLLSLCYSSVRVNKAEEIKLALEGNYNETWLFILSNNYNMWKQHQAHLKGIDKKIESLLDQLNENRDKVRPTSKPKPIRHHQPEIANLDEKLLTLYGVKISSLSGLTDYSALRLVGETGYDLSRFPTEKHFISWCQLSPRNSQSGKMNRKIKLKMKSKAGNIFREAAQSLIRSKKTAIGSFMRKIRSKKGSPIAIKAGARKLAAAYYNLITKGYEYVEQGIKQYQSKINEQEIRLLNKLAQKHDLVLITNKI